MKTYYYFKTLLSLLMLFVGMNVFAADEETKYITWDLSKDETTEASTSKLTWVNAVCSMVAARASGSKATDANEYYPGTSGKSYTSTRFYSGSTLTFTPTKGIKIISITITATSNADNANVSKNYANGFVNSTWTNGTATANTDVTPCIVTVIPVDGKNAVSVKFGEMVSSTKVEVAYIGTTGITRSTTNGKFGTICLPYIFTANDVTFYRAEMKADNSSIILYEVSAPVAGIPYIYKAIGDAGQTFTYSSGDILSSPNNNGSILTGVFVDTKTSEGDYVLQTLSEVQKFYKVEKDSEPTVSAYKAYITASAVSGAKSLGIVTEDGETQGINALNALVNGEANIYDLNGRQLNTLQKGINIVNGVKVLVK